MISNTGNTMKKKVVFLTTAVAAGSLLVGCDFLTRNPKGVESEASFWQVEGQAQRAMIGAYDVAGWNATTEAYEWMIGDINSDDASKGGEGPADFAEVEDIRNFKAADDNFVLAERWNAYYVGIGRCN